MFLTSEELKQLTGYTRTASISSALHDMRIAHKIRPDGFPVVLRAYVEKELGLTDAKVNRPKGPGPNFDALKK